MLRSSAALTLRMPKAANSRRVKVLVSIHLDITADHVRTFRNDLLAWYLSSRRDMPWRRTGDPYRIWVSEIMLQQTRVDQAEPYYRRFVERFPTVEALARADLDDVLHGWEGLGYYSRARNLHRAARKLVDEFGGTLPDRERELRSLPGVGPYTAAAVLSIAFGKPHAVLDGNVIRVLSRVFRFEQDVRKSVVRNALKRAAETLLDEVRPGAFNQALMELGATVCKPRSPDCQVCPLVPVCGAARAGDPDSFPVSAKKKPPPHYDVAVGLIRDEVGRLLIQKRPNDAMLGGLWEFPGGKRENEETLRRACERELLEELGVRVEAAGPVCTVTHAYSHFRITLYAFRCRITEGIPVSVSGAPLEWVHPGELSAFALPRASRKLLDELARSEREPSLFGADDLPRPGGGV